VNQEIIKIFILERKAFEISGDNRSYYLCWPQIIPGIVFHNPAKPF
jgi:hypothetical protein